eukprot:TRINITY_DN13280_c0_g1_i1.p1 TRINITY_DN13280_c0_g1~~TRINITY_DN13280_c0_g1_i1.p1  ORF type:complete len:188 (+),score=24.76 TRINITY_DN13280_c0_g1_i1:44-565(+)
MAFHALPLPLISLGVTAGVPIADDLAHLIAVRTRAIDFQDMLLRSPGLAPCLARSLCELNELHDISSLPTSAPADSLQSLATGNNQYPWQVLQELGSQDSLAGNASSCACSIAATRVFYIHGSLAPPQAIFTLRARSRGPEQNTMISHKWCHLSVNTTSSILDRRSLALAVVF